MPLHTFDSDIHISLTDCIRHWVSWYTSLFSQLPLAFFFKKKQLFIAPRGCVEVALPITDCAVFLLSKTSCIYQSLMPIFLVLPLKLFSPYVFWGTKGDRGILCLCWQEKQRLCCAIHLTYKDAHAYGNSSTQCRVFFPTPAFLSSRPPQLWGCWLKDYPGKHSA